VNLNKTHRIKLKPHIFNNHYYTKMNYIEDARKQVRRYEYRLQQTKDALQLYTDLMDNAVLYTWTKAQLKEQEISYAKSLVAAQESLARIEKSRRERINEMTPEEKKKEYTRMCEEREAEKIDYVLMYGFDAYEKRSDR
jgi:hypothetical protein